MWELERITDLSFVNKVEIDCGYSGIEVTARFSTGGCVCVCGEKKLKDALNKVYEKCLQNRPVIK
jgi:hypothetical protein